LLRVLLAYVGDRLAETLGEPLDVSVGDLDPRVRAAVGRALRAVVTGRGRALEYPTPGGQAAICRFKRLWAARAPKAADSVLDRARRGRHRRRPQRSGRRRVPGAGRTDGRGLRKARRRRGCVRDGGAVARRAPLARGV